VNDYIFELWVQPLTRDLRPSGQAKSVTGRRYAAMRGVAWTADGRELVYSAGTPTTSSLWRVAASGRQTPRRLMYAGSALWPAIASMQPRLTYVWWVMNGTVRRLDTRTRETKTLVQSSVSDNNVNVQFSPDGHKIAFQSTRSGDAEVWICDAEGSNCVQLTKFEGPQCGAPRWSSDGRWIALDSRASGNSEIYVVAADGGSPRRVTNNPSNNVIPSWSQDGRWIYFGSDRSGRYEVWKVARDGGEAIQVTRAGGHVALESPDGKYLYYTKFSPQNNPEPLFRMPAGGGEEVLAVPRIKSFMDFCLTSKGVYFVPPDARNTIRLLDAVSGKVSTVVTSDHDVLQPTATRYDAYVMWSQTDPGTSNLMLVEGFR
jgi:Tol biopolymer transport system component